MADKAVAKAKEAIDKNKQSKRISGDGKLVESQKAQTESKAAAQAAADYAAAAIRYRDDAAADAEAASSSAHTSADAAGALTKATRNGATWTRNTPLPPLKRPKKRPGLPQKHLSSDRSHCLRGTGCRSR